jgi:hypothetical protein
MSGVASPQNLLLSVICKYILYLHPHLPALTLPLHAPSGFAETLLRGASVSRLPRRPDAYQHTN